MSAIPWILGGGALALGAYVLTRRDRDDLPTSPLTDPLPGRWVWPVGIWRGRKPEISDGFYGIRRSPTGEPIRHGGVDLMYRRIGGDRCPVGTPNGSPNYVMPDHRAALAASDGAVWSASCTPHGWTVVIDHSPRKIATYYTHLSKLLVVPKQAVRAGQPIGIIGADPLDAAHLMHLHFEVWRGGPENRFAPEVLMRSWEYLPDPGDMPETLVARNAPIAHVPGRRFMVELQAHGVPRPASVSLLDVLSPPEGDRP
jgi:murein DD-endopeptidase MepM/ murein hydrolase activator NlpD